MYDTQAAYSPRVGGKKMGLSSIWIHARYLNKNQWIQFQVRGKLWRSGLRAYAGHGRSPAGCPIAGRRSRTLRTSGFVHGTPCSSKDDGPLSFT